MALREHGRYVVGALLFLILGVQAQILAPFQPGPSMGNLGAIRSTHGMTAHEPWASATTGDDSLRFGVSVAGIKFYDEMDNLADQSLMQGSLGGWYRFRYATVKAAVSQFNALEVYYEQSGFLSVGTRIIPFVNMSVEVRGYRVGLFGNRAAARTYGEAGISLWVPRRYVALSAELDHLPLKRAPVEGIGNDPTLRVGLHTDTRLIGAQGILAEVIFSPSGTRTRFVFGEEYWFHPMVGVTVGLATDPLLCGAGILFAWGGVGTSMSIVNHPVLGWSQGFMVDWAR